MLHFHIADLKREMQAFHDLAERKLDPTAKSIIAPLSARLDEIAMTKSGTTTIWQIRENRPLTTLPSEGAYMPNSNGGEAIVAKISFAWELQPQRKPGTDGSAAKIVALTGLASTVVTFTRAADSQTLARWTMDVGDAASPGVHFHAQVKGIATDFFPASIDVPRLPTMFVTPFSCAEFVLAELFQDEWPQHSASQHGNANLWHQLQRERFERQLDWHKTVLNQQPSVGSPWVRLKRAKPEPTLFVSK